MQYGTKRAKRLMKEVQDKFPDAKTILSLDKYWALHIKGLDELTTDEEIVDAIHKEDARSTL